jgi:hypothetical protein
MRENFPDDLRALNEADDPHGTLILIIIDMVMTNMLFFAPYRGEKN